MLKVCLISILACLFGQFSIAQTKLTKEQIDKVVQYKPYHFDFEIGRYQSYFLHDDLELNILFFQLQKTGDSLHLQGRVADYLKEGMQVEVLLVNKQDSINKLVSRLASTTVNGNFDMHLAFNISNSLYFVAMGYKDVQIDLIDLNTYLP